MRMLGIDPGSASPSGAVYQAVPEGKGGIVHAFDVPMTGTKGEDWRVDPLAFARVIETWGCRAATVERVWAMPSTERDAPLPVLQGRGDDGGGPVALPLR